MGFIKACVASGGLLESVIVDTSRFGTISLPLTGTNETLRLDVGARGVEIASGEANYRIGSSFSPGACVEARIGKARALITVVDMDKGYSIYGAFGTVIVGCSSNHDIAYSLESKASLSQAPYFLIHMEAGKGHLEILTETPGVYVNGVLSAKTAQFRFGDEISILGLSIVNLGSSLAVSNPMGMTRVHLPMASGIAEAKPQEETVFKRIARIHGQEKTEKFVIEQPAQSASMQKLPAVLTIGPMITMAVSTAASLSMSISSSGSSAASLVMAGSMLAGMLLWPTVSRKFEESSLKKSEAVRTSAYEAYLSRMENTISENIKRNMLARNSSRVSSPNIADWIKNGTLRRVWERSVDDSDFLCARIGTGEVQNPSAIEAPKPNYLSIGDPLLAKAGEIAKKHETISGAPIALDLKASNSLGLIGMKALTRAMAASLASQLAALHDSGELKLAFVFDEAKTDFDWVKKLPHVWSDDMSSRYIAQSKTEVQTLFRSLLEELESRASSSNLSPIPAFVLFVIDRELVEDMSLSSFVTANYAKTGFASIFAFTEMEDVPNGCKAIAQMRADSSSIYEKSGAERGFMPFEKEIITPSDVALIASAMSRFRAKGAGRSAGIPSTVGFMDLLKAGSVDEIGIERRWRSALPHKSLAVPIGIKGGGELFYLDIHEKAHGSHGLMAGTTGSGKSECIQAIILSLAVHFHPDDVCFVLIDFKGGGMANLFTGMPHLAGTITNLGNQIKRSMISLNAEMRNRQRMLKEAGVNHIDKYQQLYKEGKAKTPMPHMVLISDEFAELKAQKPDFMAELVSAARIGRSLGVHLILATQKPSGVVDDQIWSNTRFRICLKVADKTDSNSMIESPLAASVTLPGRAYIQVGCNEVFEQLQTAYTGADYLPTEEYVDMDTRIVTRIDSCGQTSEQAAAFPKALKSSKKMNQLDAVVGHIAQVSEKLGIKYRPIWQEPLPKILDLAEAKKHEIGSGVSVAAGLIDDPEMQALRCLEVPLDKAHIVIYGLPGCGKTTFLKTILHEAARKYSPKDLEFLIIDFGGRSLEIFEHAPHTRQVMTPADGDEITAAFQDLMEEIEIRREKFATFRTESLKDCIAKSGEPMPIILVSIDNYQKLNDEMPDASDALSALIKEGAKYGIIVLLTANAVNAVSYKLTDYFSEKYALQLGDSIDYSTVVGSTQGMFPEAVKGRGLVRYDGRVAEWQAALSVCEIDDAERGRKISEDLDKLPKKAKAKTIIAPQEAKPVSQPAKSGGGLSSLPGMRKAQPQPTKTKKSKLEEFSSSGTAVAFERVSQARYRLPMGQGMYILSVGATNSDISASIAQTAQSEGAMVLYCGTALNGYSTESDLNSMVAQIKNGTLILIEDLMEFYKAVSDADLDTFTKILESDAKISLIAQAKLSDAQILKDYPLGILLFKKWKRGMLVSGKTIDCASVLPAELLAAQSFDERNALATMKSSLVFQPDGAFAKASALAVE
ncbi:MAG: type VII secretion protein EssC [Clostridiales bacterium]|jgi:S-DNA-T family DNA segregation ATPase FtsK/SpoIIIE|nr:type VII secretion protein EssC [Clostridiales bacterium]